MIKYFLFTLSFLLGSNRVLAQLGDPFVQSYPPSAYQNKGFVSSPQNWDIIQDNRGIMYVSNTSGVLEYDGLTWQLVKGTAYESRFQLAKNSEGRIFVGSTNDFGYLAPDTSGKMQFISLLPHLKGRYPEVRIGKIAAVGADIYFSAQNGLFRWSGKGFKVWESKTGLGRIFSAQNKLYLIDKKKGLCVLENDRFKTLPGGKSFIGLNTIALLPFPEHTEAASSFFVVTFDQGLYTFRDQELKKLEATPAKVLEQEYFMQGLMLADGTIALATLSNGVVVMNYEGQINNVIDKQNGLSDNGVLNLYTDKEGGLWAGLNKGISRIEYPSPVTYLSASSGLEGIVLDVLKKNERLYAGTSSGLFVSNEKEALPSFRKLPELQNEVWQVLDVGNSLLVVSTPGVYLLKENKLTRISPPTENIIYKSIYRSNRNKDKFYIGSSDGLSALTHHKGRWKWEGKIKGVNHDVIWLAADKDDVLWASCDNNISAIDDSEEYGLQPPVRNLKPAANMAKDLRRFQAHSINGNIYFGTSKGIYTFKKHGERFQLTPDATFGANLADGSREAINLTEDKKGHIWLTSEFRTGRLRKLQDKAYVWDTIPLSRMPRVDVWTIYTDAEGVVWLGTTEGIFRYNPHVPKDYKMRQHTVLRKIKLSGDSTVFFGAFAKNDAATVEQSPRFKFKLPHAIRSISFEYAATSFDAPGQHLYSYMLEGEDEKWSHWTSETKKEFTGLDEGDYVFKVKSKNVYGAVSPVSTFEFASLPPFYRTWWAYSLYVILWGLIVWGIIKIKHQNLIESKRSLEKLVHERTAQLEAEKKKSDDLLLNILPAATAEELKANGRTVARSYDKVTVLFTDFKDFTRISEDLTPEELVAVIDFYFCAFDRIIAKYNIEKIKTIGDAYMCAGGIPDPNANTPADVVKAGLEILSFVEGLNPENRPKKHKFEIRIGIHTGPVVAGIVGTQKFAYDIWGDTVNTAARMESSCQEGKVNISGATYELVKDEFICSYRGKIDAKNKGEIDMYFVEAVVPSPVLI
ncbi:hypothetical protein DXT99_23025 [Pontibacter diazotrophicus]|uniref:Guanylate cyclase domain-containing protein n=1 Tax=Pontibacter diazotrophicus TaxID=1400979 RepID=A0A3D8L3U4_9BACT|nr:adenylate/guanylate cyclase domain-containing protein [Pontibacter diazotrophicus]RDV12006.1 hypothetical protein DXT99_23025 [Pontibacter diazotrophicus]